MKSHHGVQKYLDRYAEPEAASVPRPPKKFAHVLVIPAYQEALTDIESAFQALNDLVVILVVNSPDAADPSSLELLREIEAHWESLDAPGWFKTNTQTPVCVIDRVSSPIPHREGVGRARKIGADVAAEWIHSGFIEQPWIFLTDADARLPADYFSTAVRDPDAICRLYGFHHSTPVGAEEDLTTALYEFSLLWYPLGLKFAGSSYCFPTIGSTIACHVDAYSKVRGFPARAAGEDFYLLNKLRKLGEFTFVPAEIQLSNRRSARVPFGTGPGLKRIDALTHPLQTSFYHPEVFHTLKTFLALLKSSHEVSNLERHFSSGVIQEFVSEQDLLPLLARQQKQKSTVYHKFINDWFDAFRTLKFIHKVRDHGYPGQTYQNLWESDLLPVPCPGTSAAEIQQGTKLAWQMLRA